MSPVEGALPPEEPEGGGARRSEDALSALTRARDGAPDVQQIDQYRTFCLFALGRTKEAETLAESIVRTDPLLKLDARDASPRIEAMFSAIQKRLLPGLIRERCLDPSSAVCPCLTMRRGQP